MSVHSTARYDISHARDRTTVNLRFEVPRVTKGTDRVKMRPEEIAKLTMLGANTTVNDVHGQWQRNHAGAADIVFAQLVRGYGSALEDELLRAVFNAAKWLDDNAPTTIRNEKSPHVGWWRRYAQLIFLSRDTCSGAGNFCDLPRMQEFFDLIDTLFINADREMCLLYRSVRPDGARVCGPSFLMAVVNKGGTGPHVDGNDYREGCCCVVPFGYDWSGGELAFADLGLVFALKPGDVIFFRSALLVHENLPHVGDRRSMVLTTDENSFTAVGQPLDPQVVKEVEAFLVALRDRYSGLTANQRRQLLAQRLHAREQDKMAQAIKVESESKMDVKDVLRDRVRVRLSQSMSDLQPPVPVPVLPVPPTSSPLPVTPSAASPVVVKMLDRRLVLGKDPLRYKAPKRANRPKSPAPHPKRTKVTQPKVSRRKGANASSRSQNQVSIKKQ